MVNNNLVGGWATPLKNMISSVGMVKFPIYGKIKNIPNNQPANTSYLMNLTMVYGRYNELVNGSYTNL